MKKYFLAYLCSDYSISRDDEVSLVSELGKIKKTPQTTEIVLILNSFGGNPHSAYKCVNIIRTYCSRLTVVVPHFAKSAATLICLGADEVVMAEQSELGPLDMQIQHPQIKRKTFSALDVLNSQTYLQKKATELAYRIFDELGQKTNFDEEERMRIAFEYAEGLVNPILGKEDPRIINESARLLQLSEDYAKEFLEKYMLKRFNVDERRRKKFAGIIAERLVWGYPDHGYVISRKTADDLLLNVTKAESYEDWPKIWSFYLKSHKGRDKILKLYANIDEL